MSWIIKPLLLRIQKGNEFSGFFVPRQKKAVAQFNSSTYFMEKEPRKI